MVARKTNDFRPKSKLVLEGIEGFFVRTVTKFGSGAKVDCVKEHLGKTAYLVIVKKD